MGKAGNFLRQFFDIKFWKFILVGVLNTVVGNGLMFIFFNFTPIKYIEWGVVDGYWVSSALGYIIGSVVSYFLNKHFTFKNTEKGWKPIIRFSVNIAVCYFLAYGIAQPLTELVLSSHIKSGDTLSNIAMLVGMCLFVAFNYIGQRFFAFREKKAQ